MLWSNCNQAPYHNDIYTHIKTLIPDNEDDTPLSFILHLIQMSKTKTLFQLPVRIHYAIYLFNIGFCVQLLCVNTNEVSTCSKTQTQNKHQIIYNLLRYIWNKNRCTSSIRAHSRSSPVILIRANHPSSATGWCTILNSKNKIN